MARSRHSDKDVEEAVCYAESAGWRIEMSKGHPWARMLCEFSDRSGCIFSIWSTPKSGSQEAKRIRKLVDKCPHKSEAEGGEND